MRFICQTSNIIQNNQVVSLYVLSFTTSFGSRDNTFFLEFLSIKVL